MRLLLLILFPFCHGVLYTSGQALDECPEYNGHEEFRQFIRFYEYRAGVVGQGLAPEDVMTLVANDNMDNPRWIAPNKPFEHDLDSGLYKVGDSYRMRIRVQETQAGFPTWGGSSFRTELSGDNSRVMCPYRDYFNGTYLICCDVVEQMSVVKLIHEHFNFSAYEAYFELGLDRTRKVDKLIWRETIESPNMIHPLRDDYDLCWTREMDKEIGYWLLIDEEWQWVVRGCMFIPITDEQVKYCVNTRYHGSFLASGESHIRNLFYYIMHKVDDSIGVQNMSKAHHDLDWDPYHFKWITSTYVFEYYLHEYIEHSRKNQVPNLLFLDQGIWPIISRPIVDYVLAMRDLSYVLKIITEMGTTVIWQPIPSLPKNPFTIRADISNPLVGALNYYVCSKFRAVAGVECSPNWRLSLAWSNELICPGDSHTMCFLKTFDVTPPGRVTSDYTIKHACS